MSDSTQRRAIMGFLDALRPEGAIVGWARDPSAPETALTIRLLRGVEILAETEANLHRDDGNPGFRLEPPIALGPVDFLEGRVRVRASLPGRPVATTLVMTPRMREVLEERAGWEPSVTLRAASATPAAPEGAQPQSETEPEAAAEPTSPLPMAAPPAPSAEAALAPRRRVPLPPKPAPSSVLVAAAPVVEPPPFANQPAWEPPPPEPALPEPALPEPAPPEPTLPEPAPPEPAPPEPAPPEPTPPEPTLPEPVPPEPVPAEAPPPVPLPAHPVLRPLLALATRLDAAGIGLLHLVVPPRLGVLTRDPATEALEAEAASLPQIARDWVPLRQAFGLDPQPLALWRHDGQRPTVEGTMVALRLLLGVIRLRAPDQSAALDRVESLVARADPTGLPRREIEATTGPSFLGIPVRETEPAFGDEIYADQPAPQAESAPDSGFEAWHLASAPLAWRVVLLTEPGLGGSAGPAALGWWLRRIARECVISEALATVLPEAVAQAAPDLVLTLSAGRT